MLAPPALHGGFVSRIVWLVIGLFLCSCGIVCFLESELGLPPWDVLHQGLAEQLGISFGAANLVVSLVVLIVVWRLRAGIGLGTLLNAILVGSFVIVLTSLAWVEALSEQPLGVRIALMAVALACFGAGSAFYICASLGAARTGLEVATLIVGFLLGGTVGIGTLVFAAGIGPVVEAAFWLLGRTPLAAPAVASSAA